jgi:hypothetical protein
MKNSRTLKFSSQGFETEYDRTVGVSASNKVCASLDGSVDSEIGHVISRGLLRLTLWR